MTAHVEATGGRASRDNAKPSLRTCVVTRDERPPDEMLRFVPSPEGVVTPDLARKLPGRGVWVTCRRDLVGEAVRGKAFPRGFKRQVTVPADLADQVERLLVKRVIEALALANKAGLVVTGFAKIDGELPRGAIRVLVHGSDAAADGCGKLDRKWTAIAADLSLAALIVKELTIAELDLAMGRENVVHAALSMGGATARFAAEAGRLARYRMVTSSPARAIAAV